MFHKSDGTEVWLRTSAKLPYLTIGGILETPEDYAAIRRRLRQVYESLPGIASDDAFLLREFDDGGALIICARPDKNCALILLGKFDACRDTRKPCAVLENLVEVIEDSIDQIRRQTGTAIRLNVVQSELAMRAG